MKLAMRLPEKGRRTSADSDPREDETIEVIDLASRTAYPVVSQRKGRSDALGLAAGVGFVALLGAATLWGLNASRMGEEQQPSASTPLRYSSVTNGGATCAASRRRSDCAAPTRTTLPSWTTSSRCPQEGNTADATQPARAGSVMD